LTEDAGDFEPTMDYLLLIYRETQTSPPPDFEQACRAYDEWLREHDHLLVAIRLPAEQSITLHRRRGQSELCAGPNAANANALVALYLIRARDLNNALHIAAQLPQAVDSAIEVRTVNEMTSLIS